MYEYVDNEKLSFYNHFSRTIDYLKYTKGATFVSLFYADDVLVA